MYAQINDDIELIRGLIQEADDVDLFENFDDERDYKQEMLDTCDAWEAAQHDSSPSFFRQRSRRELEDKVEMTIDQYMEGFAEDPASRDLDYPISGMGEVLYDIEKNNPSAKEIRDDLFGKFMASFYASGFCMAYKEDAKPIMNVA